MNIVKLSRRLMLIAELVPANSRIADIGSDHALLPVYLAQTGAIQYGIAGEVNQGPWQSASKQVQDAGLDSIIDVRLGDGLEIVSPVDEIDVIIIAGMGGSLITSILRQGSGRLIGVQRLILQPNVGEENVRRWLVEHDWVLKEEHILEEDGKIYEVLVAERDDLAVQLNETLYEPRKLSSIGLNASHETLLRMGPYFLSIPQSIWYKKWLMELDKLKKIDQNMSLASSEMAVVKRRTMKRWMLELEEVLKCSQKVIQ